MGQPFIEVEVVYAEPVRQALIALTVPEGCTAADAVALADLANRIAGVDFNSCPLGVWGQPVSRDHALQDGDRVEIYRPLHMDPREARRQLAAHGQVMGGSKPASRYRD